MKGEEGEGKKKEIFNAIDVTIKIKSMKSNI
jgi:hypothetical protein